MMGKSDLPFGSEFSPSQIDLPQVLDFAKTHGGNWRDFEKAIKSAYFSSHATSDKNKAKLANNCKLGMIAYGIIDREANLTDFGKALFAQKGKDSKLYSLLAQHILLNCKGSTLIQCVQDLQAAGETVDLVKLRHSLEKYGVHFPRGGKHASIMRLWLEKAGIFTSGWRINDAILAKTMGASSEEVETLAALSKEQRYYLRTLANMGGGGPFLSNDVEKLAGATYGITFNEKNLPKQVLYPLRDAGYIELDRGTKEPGRGAKPFLVTATAKVIKDIVEPLLQQMEKQTDSELRPLLRKPLSEILAETKSTKKHVKGLALEALAFKLMLLLDMDYVGTRLRGNATGGAEVDLIFESSRLVYSRWQVQCKNTGTVSLDDVAKEVGLTHFLKSNVIVIVSTGKIGQEARRYAGKVMADSNLCVVMVDGDDLKNIEKDHSFIVETFNREARYAMTLKKLEI